MAGFSTAHWAFTFGVLGNIISFIVFLSPIPTFYKIYKKKSAEGYQPIPYVIALFSCMLWIYYALLKTNTMLLITINSFGLVIETIYVAFYLFYAPKKARRKVIKTESVEYMPLLLSVFLTLSAKMWFFYGLLLKDINIAAPNVLGFIFGILQMLLYVVYSKKEKANLKEQKLPEIQRPVIGVDENNDKKLPELTQEQTINMVKHGFIVLSDKIH